MRPKNARLVVLVAAVAVAAVAMGGVFAYRQGPQSRKTPPRLRCRHRPARARPSRYSDDDAVQSLRRDTDRDAFDDAQRPDLHRPDQGSISSSAKLPKGRASPDPVPDRP